MEDEEQNDKKKKVPNLLDLLFYFEQTGIGLPRHEIVSLNLSIWKFASTMPLENIRYSRLIYLAVYFIYIYNKYTRI